MNNRKQKKHTFDKNLLQLKKNANLVEKELSASSRPQSNYVSLVDQIRITPAASEDFKPGQLKNQLMAGNHHIDTTGLTDIPELIIEEVDPSIMDHRRVGLQPTEEKRGKL